VQTIVSYSDVEVVEQSKFERGEQGNYLERVHTIGQWEPEWQAEICNIARRFNRRLAN